MFSLLSWFGRGNAARQCDDLQERYRLAGIERDNGKLYAYLRRADGRPGGRVVPISSERTWCRDSAAWLRERGLA